MAEARIGELDPPGCDCCRRLGERSRRPLGRCALVRSARDAARDGWNAERIVRSRRSRPEQPHQGSDRVASAVRAGRRLCSSGSPVARGSVAQSRGGQGGPALRSVQGSGGAAACARARRPDLGHDGSARALADERRKVLDWRAQQVVAQYGCGTIFVIGPLAGDARRTFKACPERGLALRAARIASAWAAAGCRGRGGGRPAPSPILRGGARWPEPEAGRQRRGAGSPSPKAAHHGPRQSSGRWTVPCPCHGLWS